MQIPFAKTTVCFHCVRLSVCRLLFNLQGSDLSVNNEQKNVLLLNVSRSDAEQFSKLFAENTRYISVYDTASALELLRTKPIDLIITDSVSKSSLLHGSTLSGVAVLTVDRSFDSPQSDSVTTLKASDQLEMSRYYERFVYEALPAAIIMYYLDWRPMPYLNGNLFLLYGYSKEDIDEIHENGLRGMVDENDLSAATEVLRRASDEGIDRITLEYRMYKKNGEPVRVQEVASRFVDEDGSVGFISVFTDVTDRYNMLEKLRHDEKIMSIVGEHSERVVYYFDVRKNELRSINVEFAVRCGLPDYCVDPVSTLTDLSLIQETYAQQLDEFLNRIRNGEREGSFKLFLTCIDGVDRWFDVRSTSMSDECGSVIGAVITLLDVTEQHDREISHARYQQTIDSALSNESVFFEFDITADLVEKQIGIIEPFTESFIDKTFTETANYLSENISKKKQQRRVNTYLTRENLLEAYKQEQRRISDDWPIQLEDGRKLWIHCSVQLVTDPYTEHIKLLMTLTDVTDAKLKQLNIIYQAENDGLTGLYNRATIESKITESLEADYRNSIFILIDLDDLKYINDVLGHAQGDRAICAISDELIATFKRIGMEGRLGGDEFLVFLPNFPEPENLDELLTALLRRLSNATVGENNDNSFHCSMGIALADENVHDFAALYKRADIALYHVKSNGGNDFTYFTDDMFGNDFRYKPYEFVAMKNSALFNNLEFRCMMSSLTNFYPQILLSNLSKNTISVLASAEGFGSFLPTESSIDNFINVAAEHLHPEFTESISAAVSREALLSSYENGKSYLYFHCRLKDSDNLRRWIGVIIVFYKNADGDICGLTLIRRAEEKSVQRDVLRLQAALKVSLEHGVKTVWAIEPTAQTYETVAGAFPDIPLAGRFDDTLSPLCGLSLSRIKNNLDTHSTFSTTAGNGFRADFTCSAGDDGEIIMVVYSE